MNIPAKYNPKDVEDKWYKYWLDNKYFNSKPDQREAYTIVIPPPNVTGLRNESSSFLTARTPTPVGP